MTTGATSKLGILWEWLHKAAVFSEDDIETETKAGDAFLPLLCGRFLREDYKKLLQASNKDIHDTSKTTTLPISREIAETYIYNETKIPWLIDLPNINLNKIDLETAKKRIQLIITSLKKGVRVTGNADFKL